MGRMAVKTLTIRLSALGDSNEDIVFAYEFNSYAEWAAGQTITAATVEYAAKGAAPALTLPASTSVAGTVVGSQVQVEIKAPATAAGAAYDFTFTATFSGGNKRVGYGLLAVESPP